MTYPRSSDEPVTANVSFPALEREVLAFWAADDTFRASIEQRAGADEWVFYDGPPFANGLPHYGHLLTGYAKDAFPRFQTMRGKLVDRVFGWDTHGLPAELEAMKQLGITEKREIEQMGIDAFNAKARDAVLTYADEWENDITRQARWVDFERGYKTLDTSYMESVLWAFKRLYDAGLAYEGYRVLPYCWRDQTPLSNHELRMDDDVYQMRQDPSVTVTFPLTGDRARALDIEGARALAWTTTPWTLPTNFALAVGPDIRYVVLPSGPASEGSGRYLLAADLVAGYAGDLGYDSAEAATRAIELELTGADLAEVTYEPLFGYFASDSAWRIIADDYVTATDGTGIVHLAPYGEDDQRILEAAGIQMTVSLDAGGRFLPAVTDVAGELWMDANRPLIRLLRSAGRLLREASYEHSYPHCWRCRNPLIYMPVTSWFVRVTEIKDRLLRANQQITWAPENVKDGQFGTWLEGARDWSISRNRYWGSPIPVWQSDDPSYPRVDAYGSLDDLERDFGRLPRNERGEVDLHRPYIDDLTRPNPDDPSGQSTMRRIADVFDVWFDSGSMPFAQVHYPFSNAEWFDSHAPADFVVEYIGQTRGWFYVMHVLSVALFDRPAFTGVACHGIVLGNDGYKMSKSLQNYPNVREVFDRDGADAMRWFLLASSVLRGGNLVVTEAGIRQSVREFLLPLWNSWYFFATYANAAGYAAVWRTDSQHVLDRYILAKTGELIAGVADDLDALDTTTACARLRDFAEVLTNWYIRRSRERFWGENPDAFDTLYTVLETLTRVAAPLAPLITERVWQGLTGERSVHLSDWPDAARFPAADDVREGMDLAREVSSAANGLRKRERLRVRLPLATLTVVTPAAETLAPYEQILREELNVKQSRLVTLAGATADAYGIAKRLTVHARAAGPRLGKDVQQVIRAAKSGDWHEREGVVTAGGIELQPGEYDLDLDTSGRPEGEALTPLASGGFVILDTTVTAELAAEGLARDVIRAVQDARRAANFDVSDRIHLSLAFDDPDDERDVRAGWDAADVATETLATEWQIGRADAGEHVEHIKKDTYANRGGITIAVTREQVPS